MKLTFLGAAHEVTGSCTLLEAESEEKENAAETPAAKDAESAEMVD